MSASGCYRWLAFLSASIAGFAGGGELEIRLVGDLAKPVAVEVAGLSPSQTAAAGRFAPDDARWAEYLAVYVATGGSGKSAPAVLGTYAVLDAAIRFTPRYALRPGMAYRATARLPEEAGGQPRVLSKEFRLPEPPPGEPTKVVAIYPSAAILPENQLRFYIHFSAPMSEGEAYQHVRLMRDDGREVTRAFLEIGEELWDGTGTRLTLLFDPGRVKQGLKPREEFGPVLEEGRGYRLVVDKNWHDATGQPLASGFEKGFKAGPMIEAAVDVKQWQITAPQANTRAALRVAFPRPLDRALLHRMIGVLDAAGKGVEGEIAVSDQERRWEFRPAEAWKAGKYELVVDTALEDSAGNNLARPFEVDVFDEVSLFL
jgi:hypothetical protein